MNLTRKDLFKKVAEKSEVGIMSCENVIEAFFKTVKNELKAGNSIELRGFGKFGIKHCKAKKGRNIQAGTTIDIPAKDQMVFKFSKKA